jgi:hypothetical protein
MLRDFPTCNSFAKPKHVLPFRWREMRNNTILYILIVAKIEGGFNILPLIAAFVTDGELAGKGPGRGWCWARRLPWTGYHKESKSTNGGAARTVGGSADKLAWQSKSTNGGAARTVGGSVALLLPLLCTGSTAPYTVFTEFLVFTTTATNIQDGSHQH